MADGPLVEQSALPHTCWVTTNPESKRIPWPYLTPADAQAQKQAAPTGEPLRAVRVLPAAGSRADVAAA